MDGQTVLGAVMQGQMSETAVTNNASCVAYRVHSALISSDFTDVTKVGEIVALQTVPYIGMFVALLIAAFGHKLVHPSVCVLAFSVGGLSTLHVTFRYASLLHNWSCDAIIVASLIMGAVSALLAATLVRAVAIILGAVAGGSFVVLLFEVCASCNDPLWPNAPNLLGRSLVPFWITFAVGTSFGGFVCRRAHATVLAIVTSVIGGWGSAMTVGMAAGAQGTTVPYWGSILTASGVAILGFGCQYWLLTRSQRLAREGSRVAKPARTVVELQP